MSSIPENETINIEKAAPEVESASTLDSLDKQSVIQKSLDTTTSTLSKPDAKNDMTLDNPDKISPSDESLQQTLISTKQIVEMMQKQGVEEAKIKDFLKYVENNCSLPNSDTATSSAMDAPKSIMAKKFTIRQAFEIIAFLGLSAAVASALMSFTGSAAVVTALSLFGRGFTLFAPSSSLHRARLDKKVSLPNTKNMIFWCGGLLYLGYGLITNFF